MESDGIKPQYNQVFISAIRRVMPTVIADSIIGVQPMTGPAGLIHEMRARYNRANILVDAEALTITYNWEVPDEVLEWCADSGIVAVATGTTLQFDEASDLDAFLLRWNGADT